MIDKDNQNIIKTIAFIAVAKGDQPQYSVADGDIIDSCVHDETVVCSHNTTSSWVNLINHTWKPTTEEIIPEPVSYILPEVL